MGAKTFGSPGGGGQTAVESGGAQAAVEIGGGKHHSRKASRMFRRFNA